MVSRGGRGPLRWAWSVEAGRQQRLVISRSSLMTREAGNDRHRRQLLLAPSRCRGIKPGSPALSCELYELDG